MEVGGGGTDVGWEEEATPGIVKNRNENMRYFIQLFRMANLYLSN